MQKIIFSVLLSAIATISTASPDPVKCDYVFGIGRFALPNPNIEIIEPTKKALIKAFPESNVCIRSLSTKDLESALNRSELDFFIASSGMYRRMLHTGIRDIAAVIGPHITNANYAEGTTFVAAASKHSSSDSIRSFRNGILAAGIPAGFTGYLAGMHELKKQGVDVDSFFLRTEFVGSNQFEVLRRLLSGQADLGMLRTCMFEYFTAEHPELKDSFVVINEKKHEEFSCRHSTELYPSWVFGVSSRIDVETATAATTALLKMPNTSSGLAWGIATDFTKLDELMRDLSLGQFKLTDKWLFSKIWEQYRTHISFFACIILFVLLHAWRSDVLVKKRTKELNAAHEHELTLENERNAAREKILDMQRIGVVGQFSSMLIHELGQPNSANQFLIHAFRRRMETQPPTRESVEEILTKLLSNVQREQQLINKVRKYTKKSTSRKPVDALDCLSNAQAVVSQSLARKIEFSMRIPSEAVFVSADELELEILFVNLIKNAVEAVAEIEHPQIDIECLSKQDSVEFFIRDNGPLLSDDQMKLIGVPLNSTKNNGLGLGLYICQMIVENLGGNLTFERASPLGGVCSKISLPAKDAQNVKLEH